MNKLVLAVLGTALLTTACEQAQKAKESYSAISKLKDAGEKMEASMDAAKSRREEREKRGDTLSMPYKELQAYLPTEVSGYTAANPTGQSMKMSGIAFSTVGREFTKDSVTVKTEIIDYNGANQLYQGASAMLGLGLESEDDEQLTKSASLGIDGASGMETYRKKDRQAELMLAVGGRFLIKVTADKQPDTELVESVAKQMQLEKLAEL
ncbi:hypothetical protein ACFPAF_07705 [Hymenobacter endophyticus]|uniref:DUF4252 domain-containing protein n=1 Tax=Hymenobacter endophyticus TaxID=3076335 RepID=A0ABU3TFX3_9BACT|nr:hypothetical protein [Hymenobacter endophyticus]MDU0370270.1 hypothetical protein [Hymenobacter endophyticus]